MAPEPPVRVQYCRRIRTVTGWTILFMVLLRVAIGWHFLYEGIVKVHSGGAFSSTPYLMASVGPLKDVFHWMVDDMDGAKKRMTRDYLYSKIDERHNAILKFYGRQDESLVANLTARQAKGEKLSANEQAKLDAELKKLTSIQIESLKLFVERKKKGTPDDNTVAKLFADDALFQKIYTSAGEYVDPDAPDKTDRPITVAYAARPEKRAEIVGRIQVILDELDKTVREGAKAGTPEQRQKALDPLPPATIAPAGTPDEDVSWITPAYVEKLVDDRYEMLKKQYALANWQHSSRFGWCYADQKKHGHYDKNSVDYILGDPDFQKALEDYKALLAQIDKEEQAGKTKYDSQRLDFNTAKKGKLRSALLARIEAPLREIDLQKLQDAPKIPNQWFSENLGLYLTAAQISNGPMPTVHELEFPGNLLKKAGVDMPKQTLTFWQDLGMMLGLTAIGACLVLGLFTRFSAVCGAGMLAMFYLAMPPFPGVNVPENAAEGHYLFVNKNLIELIALLMLATSGAGRWFGLDAIIHAIFGRSEPELVETAAGTEPYGVANPNDGGKRS